MSTYLVTGGGGFIGCSIVRELLGRGEIVRVIDDFSTGRRANLEEVADRIQLTEASITDEEALMGAMDGVDYVLHQAAIPSVPRSVEEPLAANHANLLGTLSVLEAARKTGVRRVVFAASSSAYGESPTLPKEESLPAKPLSPYAASKLAGENYAFTFSHCYGVETVSLRYFNIFGPRQDPKSEYAAVIPRFITSYIRGESPTVFGDGEQSRDFCFVENAVQANLQACTADGASGLTFNIACGDETSLLGVLDQLAEIFGRRIEPKFAPARAGDVKHSRASIERAREILGYEPRVRFASGLKRTAEWFQELA